MRERDYKVIPYEPGFKDSILDLLSDLWGASRELNLARFDWKYEENPYAEVPLGIVATREADVVGFRGYFASRWSLPSGRELSVLVPGDTIVHPDHRRRGLSVKMGMAAAAEFEEDHDILLNMTCSDASLPGYISLGFEPLTERAYLSRFNMRRLLTRLFYCRGIRRVRPRLLPAIGLPLEERVMHSHQGETMILTRNPRPLEMARIDEGLNDASGHRIHLRKDEQYTSWRYGNPGRHYVFIYHTIDGETKAYLCVLIDSQGRGSILDWAGPPSSIRAMIEFLAESPGVTLLKIYHFSTTPELASVLGGVGFSRNPANEWVNGRSLFESPLPVLVCPAKPDPSESDWFVDGSDIRDIGNWSIREICSDSV